MLRDRLRAPTTWLVCSLLLAGIPLGALGWVGWRMLEQDRALEAQRRRTALDNTATLVAREIDRGLAAWSDLLLPFARGEQVSLPKGAIALLVADGAVARRDGVSLPYYPRVASPQELPVTLFAEGEAAEFQDRDLVHAANVYRAAAQSGHPAARAAALMRLARVLRKNGHVAEAFAVYDELAALHDAPVAGAPAELVALRERHSLLRASGRDREADEEAARLAEALDSGRFLIDRATRAFYEEALSPRPAARASDETQTVTAALERFWPLWEQQPAGRAGGAGGAMAFAAVWQATPAGTAVIVAPLDTLIAPAASLVNGLETNLTLVDESGRPMWGGAAGSQPLVRDSRQTGLPWTIRVAQVDSASPQLALARRQNVFVAGFGLLLLVVAGASYVVFRAVHRELGVARLQSEFVATVSHEFRTPLTAMCHLTELLEEGQTPAERLPEYHRALGRESRRLHAMVEKLLDFRRLESGRASYQFVDMDARALVARVVQVCRDQAPSVAHRLQWQAQADAEGPTVRILADPEALSLALRNLVDNAVKYSPATSMVRVSLESRGDFVGIAVEDDGIGISREERRRIFQKFTRGAAARVLNVKGTGIGLTMAHEIVRAHGGRLELTSQPGRGTRFTTVLPVQPSHA